MQGGQPVTATKSAATTTGDATGLHRVLEPAGVLPQAALRLDTRRELWPDEVRIRVERLNLDAASFRQLERKHAGDGAAVRAEVLDIIETRGKMQNPETGSGGMLVGTV
jgi:L-erythro-3,5-diaminohexanoate dehydrogenase